MIRKQLRIHGIVQGVGFRYRAREAAGFLGITGWAHNEWDGTVLMEVQGTQEQFDKLLVMIARGGYVHIEQVEEKTLPLEEHESGFYVR